MSDLPPVTGSLNVTLDPVKLVGGLRVLIHRALPEDHEFYAVIGRVASEAAHLDHLLDIMIWELSGTEHAKAACITSQMFGPTPRFRSIIALCEMNGISKKITDRVASLMQRTFDAIEGRNRIVHDAWYVEEGSGKIAHFRVMPKGDPEQFGTKDTDQAEIEETLTTLRKRRHEASELRSEILTALSTLRETRR